MNMSNAFPTISFEKKLQSFSFEIIEIRNFKDHFITKKIIPS